ncbi:hypothetical protein Tsubulata_040710 [Turnera subulata]|uniref:Uncharacterized protein n=1 Tax=Turnera subulata TaxID=218843 RepID=A0A9Q0JQ43_9ROSI|nr:hypothetical protein Tsubulata_040710 [Turnera subulata]
MISFWVTLGIGLLIYSMLLFPTVGRYYNSLPPISKPYGTLCLAFTTVVQLGLLDLGHIALIYPLAFSRFQILQRSVASFHITGTIL